MQQEAGVDDGFVFFVHGIGDGDEIGLVVRVVVVFHPVLDGAGSDGGKKRFFVLLTLQAGLEVGDFRLQRFMADVFERRVAKHPFDVVAAMGSARVEVIAELGQVPGVDRRGLVAGFDFTLDEAAQPVARVAGEVRLARFAVIDDVEAAGDLFLDDVGDGAGHAFGKRLLDLRHCQRCAHCAFLLSRPAAATRRRGWLRFCRCCISFTILLSENDWN